MKRINFLILVFSIFPFTSIGQGQSFYDEAEVAFQNEDHDLAFSKLQNAYTAFEEEKDSTNMTLCLLRQGFLLKSKSQRKESIATYQKAARLAKAIGADGERYYMRAINAIAVGYLFSQKTKEAIPILKECIELGQEIGFPRRYSSLMITLGRAYGTLGQLDSAKVWLEDALQIKRDIGHERGKVNALNALSELNYQLHNYERALAYEKECMELSIVHQDSSLIFPSFKNLSNIYIGMEDWEKAEENAIKAYEVAIKFSLLPRQALCLSNLALINNKKGAVEKAKEQYQEAIKIYRKINNQPLLIDNLLMLSKIHFDQEEFERAKELITEAYDLAFSIDHKNSILSALLTFGDFYLKNEKPEEALPLLLEANSLADSVALNVQKKEASQLLAQAYTQLEQYKPALEWQQNYNSLSDTIHKNEKKQNIKELETRYEVKEKEKEIELLHTKTELDALEIQTANRRQFFLIIGLVLLIALVGLGVFFYKTKQRDNQLLEEKNIIISQALSDKELLLKEIHHRVKNNLQVVSSLLSMQSNQIKNEQALDAMRESKNRVRSMALIHQNLYLDADLATIDSKAYIEKLAENLFNSYNIDPQRISLQTQIDPLKLEVDIMIPLGLILNELISNALKYAFEKEQVGQIDIQLQQKENWLEMDVNDNGIGLPAHFKLEESESMGFIIIKDFCRKLKAKLHVQNQNGTNVKLSIPHPNL